MFEFSSTTESGDGKKRLGGGIHPVKLSNAEFGALFEKLDTNVIRLTFSSKEGFTHEHVIWPVNREKIVEWNRNSDGSQKIAKFNHAASGMVKGQPITDEQALAKAYADLNSEVMHILKRFVPAEKIAFKAKSQDPDKAWAEVGKWVVKLLSAATKNFSQEKGAPLIWWVVTYKKANDGNYYTQTKKFPPFCKEFEKGDSEERLKSFFNIRPQYDILTMPDRDTYSNDGYQIGGQNMAPGARTAPADTARQDLDNPNDDLHDLPEEDEW